MLWHMAHGDILVCIADRFGIVPSTVMQTVNSFLYIIVRKYIAWPQTEQDRMFIQNGFVVTQAEFT